MRLDGDRMYDAQRGATRCSVAQFVATHACLRFCVVCTVIIGYDIVNVGERQNCHKNEFVYPVFHPLMGLDSVCFSLLLARTCLGSS